MEPYRTKDGQDIPLVAVGRRFVEQVMQQHPLPEVPTYTVETAAGEVEVHPHKVERDETGAITDSTFANEEDAATWAAYEAAQREAIAERYQAATNFLLYNCIPAEPTPAESWGLDFTLWDLQVPDPTDRVAYKLFWLENVYLPDSDDLAGILARLYEMAGIIARDRAGEFEAFFRFALARLSAGRAGD